MYLGHFFTHVVQDALVTAMLGQNKISFNQKKYLVEKISFQVWFIDDWFPIIKSVLKFEEWMTGWKHIDFGRLCNALQGGQLAIFAIPLKLLITMLFYYILLYMMIKLHGDTIE